MRFISTKGRARPVSLTAALRNGAAPDGGLYLPERLPEADVGALDADAPLADFAAAILRPFFVSDPLEGDLSQICAEALDFEAPLVTPGAGRPPLQALELFHGPTGAFKDFGARFLVGCFERIAATHGPLTVLAATSGDTGGAVGCAVQDQALVRAVILFPRGRVSPFQERQLTCWGDQVLAIEVDGDFDDCQRLVKMAFADRALTVAHRLTSANSINFGRLMPQLAYAAHAALRAFKAEGKRAGFVVPTGNLGHGFAVLLARAMGVPIGPVILSTNANPTLFEWQQSGRYEPRGAIQTLANAMDVGDPSNFERLSVLLPELGEFKIELVADAKIKSRISADFGTSGYVWCPHSATAAEAWSRLPEEARFQRPWVAAATAHPFKFKELIEPLINQKVEPSAALLEILGRPTRKIRIGASLGALTDALSDHALAA